MDLRVYRVGVSIFEDLPQKKQIYTEDTYREVGSEDPLYGAVDLAKGSSAVREGFLEEVELLC